MTKPKIERLGPGIYSVESRSHPGEFHEVDSNEPFCPCPAFYWRGGCRHLREVAEFLGKNEVSVSE